MPEAARQLLAAEAVIEELRPLTDDPALRTGSFSAALEEYAEASIFRNFLQTGAVLPHRLLRYCDGEEYLGGLLDFAGELNRFAVARATRRDAASVRHCRDVLDGLNGVFLQFNFRNGSLRQKYDGLKYTVQKVENLLYELSLREPAPAAEARGSPEGSFRQVQGEGERPAVAAAAEVQGSTQAAGGGADRGPVGGGGERQQEAGWGTGESSERGAQPPGDTGEGGRQ